MTAREVLGEMILFSALLEEAPSPGWQATFSRVSLTGPVVCDQDKVTFRGAELLFLSPEDHATLWVKTIDEWIEHVNSSHRQELQSQVREAEALKARLRRATDIVKDL